MTDKEKYRLLCSAEDSIPVFSRDWWLDVVCGKDKWDVLLVEEKERIRAAMPLYLPFPNIVSMPGYTQTMGPWFAPEAKDSKYVTVLGNRQAYGRALTDKLERYTSFMQNFNYEVSDWLPFCWAGYRQTTRYTYLLKDICNSDSLLAEMSANTRRNLTKAKDKYGITVSPGIPADDFLKMHLLTFERQKMKAPQPALLKRLITVCRERGQGDLWGGYDAVGRLYAAAFVVWQTSSAYYIAGGGDPALRESGAHSRVLWEAIRYVSRFTGRFDFEGSMLPGVERFFREFGGIQTPFFTIYRGAPSLLSRVCMKLSRK